MLQRGKQAVGDEGDENMRLDSFNSPFISEVSHSIRPRSDSFGKSGSFTISPELGSTAVFSIDSPT
jgi:hypothetical protein